MRRIDKACKDPERTSELLKLPGVKSYPGGLKITIMNNFCPVHYHMQVKGCVIGPLGTKDCIKCWKEEVLDEID
jgi:hypothetical protein